MLILLQKVLYISNKNLFLCHLLILICILIKLTLFIRKIIKKTLFTPNVEWIKSNYFSSHNNTKRAYFQTLPSQAENALRKQYEKYMNQKKITIPFFYWFFKLKKQRKQLMTLRNEEGHQLAIKHSENIQKRILTITS